MREWKVKPKVVEDGGGGGGEEKKGAGNRILKKTGSGREIQYMHNINIIMHNIKFCEFFNL